MNMSLKERDDLYHELHGVAQEVRETPEFMALKFQELRAALSEVLIQNSPSNCQGFLDAEAQNSQHVHSKRHYKMFLRAERFDAKAAAIRMLRFFNFKRRNFGVENLCRDITQDLLSAQDMEAYRQGFQQLLPWRDRAGRAISMVFPHRVQVESAESLVRRIVVVLVVVVVTEYGARKPFHETFHTVHFTELPPHQFLLLSGTNLHVYFVGRGSR